MQQSAQIADVDGSVADSDTQPGFWTTLISGAGAPSEGTGAGGSLLLNVTGASGGNQFPFTEIASPLQNSFNFFRAPIVIQASLQGNVPYGVRFGWRLPSRSGSSPADQ